MDSRVLQTWATILLLLGGLGTGLARAGGICCGAGEPPAAAVEAPDDGCCQPKGSPRPSPDHGDDCPPDGQCPRACCAGVVMGDVVGEAPAPAEVCVGLAEHSPGTAGPVLRDDDLLRPPRA